MIDGNCGGLTLDVVFIRDLGNGEYGTADDCIGDVKRSSTQTSVSGSGTREASGL
jgi:hypothetical protein